MILVQVSIPYPVIGGQRIMPDTLLRQGDTDSRGTSGAAFIRLFQAEKIYPLCVGACRLSFIYSYKVVFNEFQENMNYVASFPI
ncbi:MAG: hypothetical protein ACP5FP_04170 [Desulfuromonadaceae bacterium]